MSSIKAVSMTLAILAASSGAFAQYTYPPYTPPPTYPPYTAPPPTYPPPYTPPPAYPPYTPPPPTSSEPPISTKLEIGYLYGAATTWGVGTGIWIDSEFRIDDPGVQFVMPAIFGVAAPIGVYVWDRRAPMPEGMPSAIATGMVIGGGEAMGIASYSFVSRNQTDAITFRGLARTEWIGSTLGGAAGYAYYRFKKPIPETNLFLASGVGMGTVVGSLIGGGLSSGNWGNTTNDSLALGGLIGLNVGLAGAVGLSFAWKPTWNQMEWMWAGLGVGSVAALPVYLFYIGSDRDPRRGLVVQGITGTLGIVAGAFYGAPRQRDAVVKKENKWIGIDGGGFVPSKDGLGFSVSGHLW